MSKNFCFVEGEGALSFPFCEKLGISIEMTCSRQISNRTYVGILAYTLLLSGCVSPMASQSAQTSPLRKGDGFTLLSPAKDGHPLQAMDIIVLTELETRAGTSPSGEKWMLEYSYAVRPAAITLTPEIKQKDLEQTHANAMLVCRQTNHRVTVRIIAKDDGNQSYRGSAELIDCRSDLGMDEILFKKLLTSSLDNLKIE